MSFAASSVGKFFSAIIILIMPVIFGCNFAVLVLLFGISYGG